MNSDEPKVSGKRPADEEMKAADEKGANKKVQREAYSKFGGKLKGAQHFKDDYLLRCMSRDKDGNLFGEDHKDDTPLTIWPLSKGVVKNVVTGVDRLYGKKKPLTEGDTSESAVLATMASVLKRVCAMENEFSVEEMKAARDQMRELHHKSRYMDKKTKMLVWNEPYVVGASDNDTNFGEEVKSSLRAWAEVQDRSG